MRRPARKPTRPYALIIVCCGLGLAGCNTDRLPVGGPDKGARPDLGAPSPDRGTAADIPVTPVLDSRPLDLPKPFDGPPKLDLPPPPPKGLPIDVLFVIDNSGSMEQEQKQLAANFPRLIEALRRTSLGPDGSGKPCTVADTSGCNIPDLRIGVVTTDVGAGNYSLPSCEVANGDNGKLQNAPRLAGCTGPSNPWIAYSANTKTSNVPSGAANHIDRIKDAFACIAPVGIQGCGFEQTLESARRALDPKLNINPGFLRPNALLVVVFITDEDDCSAKNPQLYDPNQQSLSDPLGPLTSFRCFEFGISCDINDRDILGPRSNCVPAYDWLHSVDSYDTFFKGLKPPGHVVLGAIAGPTSPVNVGRDGPNPVLKPSCQTSNGFGVPAIRIKSLVDRFWGHYGDICDNDYGPSLKKIADLIAL